MLITVLSVGTFTSVFKNYKSLRSLKTVEIEAFLNFLGLLIEGSKSGSVQVITDPNPGPGGPKTNKSGSGTLP